MISKCPKRHNSITTYILMELVDHIIRCLSQEKFKVHNSSNCFKIQVPIFWFFFLIGVEFLKSFLRKDIFCAGCVYRNVHGIGVSEIYQIEFIGLFPTKINRMMSICIIPFPSPCHFKREILIPNRIYPLSQNKIIKTLPDTEYIFRW